MNKTTRKKVALQQEKVDAARRKEELDALVKSSQQNEFLSETQQSLADAQYARDIAEDLYGESNIGRVEAYVQLAAALLNVDDIATCEQYLTQVHWIVVNSGKKLPATLESRIHRALGKFYLVKTQASTALAHFAEDVYFSSCAYGASDPQCCGGYFYMSIIFEEHDQIRCDRFRRILSRIWRKFLFNRFTSMVTQIRNEESIDGESVFESAQEDEEEGALDDVLAAECQLHSQTLYQICCGGDTFDVVGCDASLSLILLALLSGDASVLKIKTLLEKIAASPDQRAQETKHQAAFVNKHVADALS
eukprot:m.226120 g.226120  ORF g.226120 m.226120 type:complete len:306 (-) comp13863_c5_seq4:5180-6097(-)